MQPLPDFPPPEAMDGIYLSSALEDLEHLLRRARSKLSSLRDEICALPAEPALPSSYRAFYGRIVSLLATTEQAIKDGEICTEDIQHEFYSSDFRRESRNKLNSSPAVVEAAKDIIQKINAAEIRLLNVAKSAKNALIKQSEQNLIDWTMPYDGEFAVIFNPGPERAFYTAGANDFEEPLRIRIRPARDLTHDDSFNDSAQNWNVFEGQEGHPLREGHHGYLVHCLFDHTHMPWQLLPYIQEIEIEFRFYDCGTVWASSIRPGK
jgi:hypothetical protein